MEVQKLHSDLIAKLKSCYTISNFTQCVMELVFNSLDAHSTAISVRINFVLFRIKVVDNGDGITKEDLKNVGVRYMTSKIKKIEDMKKTAKYYGYRGEALASMTEVSKSVEITSRRRDSDETYSITIRKNSSRCVNLVKKRPSCGTTVTVEDFFFNLTVRRNSIVPEIEIHDLKNVVESLGMIQPNVSFTLRDDISGELIVSNQKQTDIVASFKYFHPEIDSDVSLLKTSKNKILVEALLFKELCDNRRLQYIFVNKRPVYSSKIKKFMSSLILKSRKREKGKLLDFQNMYPIYILNIKCPYSLVIYSLHQTKIIAEFANWDIILHYIQKVVNSFFGTESKLKKENMVPSDTSLCNGCGPSVITGAVQAYGYKRTSDDSAKDAVNKIPKLDNRPTSANICEEVEASPEKIDEAKQLKQNLDHDIYRISDTTSLDKIKKPFKKPLPVKIACKEKQKSNRLHSNMNISPKHENIIDMPTNVFPQKQHDEQSVTTTFTNNELKGKKLIMDMFLKSTQVFGSEGSISDGKSEDTVLEIESNMCVENNIKTNVNGFSKTMSVSVNVKSRKVFKRKRCGKKVSKCVQTTFRTKSVKSVRVKRKKSKRKIHDNVDDMLQPQNCTIVFSNTAQKFKFSLQNSNVKYDVHNFNDLDFECMCICRCHKDNDKLFDFHNLPKTATDNKGHEQEKGQSKPTKCDKSEKINQVIENHLVTDHKPGNNNNYLQRNLSLENNEPESVHNVINECANNCLSRPEDFLPGLIQRNEEEYNHIDNYMQINSHPVEKNIPLHNQIIHLSNEDVNHRYAYHYPRGDDKVYQHNNPPCSEHYFNKKYIDNMYKQRKYNSNYDYYKIVQRNAKHPPHFNNHYDLMEHQYIQPHYDHYAKRYAGPFCSNYGDDFEIVQQHGKYSYPNRNKLNYHNRTIGWWEGYIRPKYDIASKPLAPTESPYFNRPVQYYQRSTQNYTKDTREFQGNYFIIHTESPYFKCIPQQNHIKTDALYEQRKKRQGANVVNDKRTSNIRCNNYLNPQIACKRAKERQNTTDKFSSDNFHLDDVINNKAAPSFTEFRPGYTSSPINEMQLEEVESDFIFCNEKYVNQCNPLTELNVEGKVVSPTTDNFKFKMAACDTKSFPPSSSELCITMSNGQQQELLNKELENEKVFNFKKFQELSTQNTKTEEQFCQEGWFKEMDKCGNFYYINKQADPETFFENLYREKAKQFEESIPDALLQSKEKHIKETFSFNKELFRTIDVIGQIDKKFIGALERKQNLLLLFDQHAVHERIRLEQLIKDYKGVRCKCEEIVIFLPTSNLRLLSKHREYLISIDLTVTFYTNSLNISEVPVYVYEKFKNDVTNPLPKVLQLLITDVVEILKSTRGGSAKALPKLFHDIISLEACRGAIKFGDILNKKKCKNLLQMLSTCNLPFQCAHGRPTLVPLLTLNADENVYAANKIHLKTLLK